MADILRLAAKPRLSAQAATPAAKRGAPQAASVGVLSEVFAETVSDAGAVGFALAHTPPQDAPVFWVQDRMTERESGIPYMPALPGRTVIRARVSRPLDVLWAMEEGLQSASLGLVIGEIWGDPAVLNFTATKRLAFRAEAHGMTCWLLRRSAVPNLSAARNRWRVASLPSLPHRFDPQAPGMPRWRAELFRSRAAVPGTWIVRYDHTAHRLHFDAPVPDRAVDAGAGADPRRAAR